MTAPRAFKVCIVRHGERADHVFGQNWTSQFFESDGTYFRADLNMPAAEDMPKRPLDDWLVDPPITEIGRFQARQLGSALGKFGDFHAIVCSPALRCLQTAEEIRRALPTKPGVVTEPGLYEMTSWGSPRILDLFRANADQYSITTVPPADEGVDAWYERSAKVFSDIVERHQTYGREDLLIIAHGLSHEALTYRMLWNCGTVPLEVQQAVGHEAKIQAMCKSTHCGLAPIDSYCGTATLLVTADGHLKPFSSWKGNSSSESVPLWLSHRQNLPFVFQPLSDVTKQLARVTSSSPASPSQSRAGTAGPAKTANGEKPDDSISLNGTQRLFPSSSSSISHSVNLSASFVAGRMRVAQAPMIPITSESHQQNALGAGVRQAPQQTPGNVRQTPVVGNMVTPNGVGRPNTPHRNSATSVALTRPPGPQQATVASRQTSGYARGVSKSVNIRNPTGQTRPMFQAARD